jgi:hypothetical protein
MWRVRERRRDRKKKERKQKQNKNNKNYFNSSPSMDYFLVSLKKLWGWEWGV